MKYFPLKLWLLLFIPYLIAYLIFFIITRNKNKKYKSRLSYLEDIKKESFKEKCLIKIMFIFDILLLMIETKIIRNIETLYCVIGLLLSLFLLILQSFLLVIKTKTVYIIRKLITKILFSVIFVLLIFSFNIYLIFGNKKEKINYKLIVHAGGGKDENRKLNSQEVFLEYVNQGFNLIEVDFLFDKNATDVFCTHQFEYMENYSFLNRPTIQQVKNEIKLLDQYKPIYLDWLLNILIKNKNLTIIVDSKESDEDYFKLLQFIIKKCKIKKIDYKNRLIPCVFSKQNYEDVHKLNFTQLWYSNYRERYSWEEMYDYFKDKKDMTTYVLSRIEFLVDKVKDFDPKEKSVDIYSVNGRDKVEYYSQRGADYIVSDFPYVK